MQLPLPNPLHSLPYRSESRRFSRQVNHHPCNFPHQGSQLPRILWSEKRALVESTIIEMGLQDCADTVIGNWHLRGISGREKRRVSIALEILMRPRLLFLDEPTSGLNSASAFFVTQTLGGLSRDGRTLIASIHQPSSEVFELFDRLYLLSGGKSVYFGKTSEACEEPAGSCFMSKKPTILLAQ